VHETVPPSTLGIVASAAGTNASTPRAATSATVFFMIQVSFVDQASISRSCL
jgi:hypothetical protein